MTNADRFDKFKKVFPSSELTLAKWSKLKTFTDNSPILLRLDMSIFPDTLEELSWVCAPLMSITFIESQVNLKVVILDSTNINSLVLPDSGVKLTHLSADCAPITKVKLGASAGTLESLILPMEMPRMRVSFPEGMVKLKTLVAGTNLGPVIIPKDLVSLKSIKITTNAHKVRIPDTLVNLERITLEGDTSALSIPQTLTKVTELFISAQTAIPFSLPRVNTIKTLNATITGGATEFIVPKAMGESLKIAFVSGGLLTKLVMPKSTPELESVDIYLSEGAETVEIASDAEKLTRITVRGASAKLKGELSNLKSITFIGSVLTIAKGATLTSLGYLMMHKLAVLVGTFPKDLPELKTIFASNEVIAQISPKSLEEPEVAVEASAEL